MNLKNDQWQNFTEAVDLLCKHKFCIAKCVAKCSSKFVLLSKITAMQNFKLLYIHVFCIAQTALQKKWLNSIPGSLKTNRKGYELLLVQFVQFCELFFVCNLCSKNEHWWKFVLHSSASANENCIAFYQNCGAKCYVILVNSISNKRKFQRAFRAPGFNCFGAFTNFCGPKQSN